MPTGLSELRNFQRDFDDEKKRLAKEKLSKKNFFFWCCKKDVQIEFNVNKDDPFNFSSDANESLAKNKDLFEGTSQIMDMYMKLLNNDIKGLLLKLHFLQHYGYMMEFRKINEDDFAVTLFKLQTGYLFILGCYENSKKEVKKYVEEMQVKYKEMKDFWEQEINTKTKEFLEYVFFGSE